MPKLPDGNGRAIAKGRNGYFTPDSYTLSVAPTLSQHSITPRGRIDLDIYSRSPARSAPLTIGLSVEQWRAVIADLERAVNDAAR